MLTILASQPAYTSLKDHTVGAASILEGQRVDTGVTCGEDNIPGDQTVLHNGELWELNPFHTSDSLVPAAPVKFNVVRGVAIYQEREAGTWWIGDTVTLNNHE